MAPNLTLLGQLYRLTSPPPDDAELLCRFVERRDEEAFTALVARHRSMVHGVCRRVLGNTHDADDAFQAVFLILARKAAALRHPEALVGWLHGVAVRVARKARGSGKRLASRQTTEPVIPTAVPDPHPDPLDALTARELLGLIDQEIARLPEAYRLPLVLCDLEQRTQPEAARLLGWTLGSFRGRLLRGRERLRKRLARRGIAPAVLAAAFLQGSADAAVQSASIGRLAVHFSASPATTEIPPSVAALVREGTPGLVLTKLKLASLFLLAASTFAAGAGLLAWPTPAPPPQADERAETQPPVTPTSAKSQLRWDQAGDPLPAEAVARLGTVRLRHGGTIHSIAFTADGDSLVSQGEDDVRIWDVATGKEIPRVANRSRGTLSATDVSPDGKFAVVYLTERDANVGLLEVATGRIVLRFSQQQVHSLCFSPDARMIATIGYLPSEIYLRDRATGKALGTLKGYKGWISSMEFSADGKTFVSGGDDRTIRLWDVAEGKEQRKIVTPNPVEKVAFSPDGRLLASLGLKRDAGQGASWGQREALIRLWDARTGKALRQLTMKPFEISRGRRIGFSTFLFGRDGRTLITGGYDGVVRIWATATGKELRTFPGFVGGPLAFALHPDGKTLAVVDGGSAIRLIRLDTGTDRFVFPGHRAGVGSVHLRPDGRVAVTSSWDELLHWWDVQTEEVQRKITGKSGEVLQLLPDGKTYLAAGGDQKLHVHDLDTGKAIREIHGWNGRPYQFVVSPDGRVLAQEDLQNKKVQLIDPATGKTLHTLTGFEQLFMRMHFTPDSRTLYIWTIDKSVTVWDVATGEKQRQFSCPADIGPGPSGRFQDNSYPSYTATLSPDGKLLAFGFQGNAPRPDILPVFDAATGKEICRFTTAPDGVSSLAFSPDGKSLAWGGWRDGTVYLGEIANGRQRHRYTGHQGRILSVAFSDDGNKLISGSWDTTALVWDLTGQLPSGKEWGKRLGDERLKACWQSLASEDAEHAFRAMQSLVADPAHSVLYLRARLHPIAPADENRLQLWLADLDSDQFTVRERATAELKKLGPAALHAMRKALENKPALETRRRLEPLIEKLEREEWPPSGERLRVWRALEVLERIGTPEARDVLTKFASGAPGTRYTLEARNALQRLPH